MVNKKIFYTFLAFIIPFAVYLFTLAPTVSWIDSDELSTASSLLRVAHPTGYPLFTVLGKIFTLIPSGNKVYMLNIMSAVISSAAVSLFFNLMVFLYAEFKLRKSDKLISKNLSLTIIYNISLTSALILAFSKTYWKNANVIEVYSLHSFFLVLLIFLFLKANCRYPDNDNLFKNEKYWLLFAFALGLSFANHMTTGFLALGFFYLYFSDYGFTKSSLKNILYLSIPFVAGLTLYIYLFVRADNSMLSWGHTFNFENFIAHVTGRQYNTAMFRSAGDLKIQFIRFFNEYPKEFVYLNILLIVPGLILLYRNSRRLFYFTLILFVSCIVLASNYNIFDIYPYFLLTSVITAIWIGFGLFFIIDKVKNISSALSYGFIIIFLIPLSLNFAEADKSRDYIVRDYVFNLFNSSSQNSIIISNYNPTYYFQYVEKVRPDIIFINRDYLYNKWYVNSIIAAYPEIYEKSKSEFDIYSAEVDKLHSNKSKYLSPKTSADSQAILKFQKSLRDLLNSIIENNYKEKDVYTTQEIDEVNDEKFAEGYNKIPNGVLLKLTNENSPDDYKKVDLKYDVSYDMDFFKSLVMNLYYKSRINEANYLIDRSEFTGAEELINKALEIKPDSKEAKQLLEKLKTSVN